MKLLLVVLASVFCSLAQAQGFLPDSRIFTACEIFQKEKLSTADAFITIPKGVVITLRTKSRSGEILSQHQCMLSENIFPYITTEGNLLFAFDLRNGQEVYTKHGEKIQLYVPRSYE